MPNDNTYSDAVWVFSAPTLNVWVPVASHNSGKNNSQWRSNGAKGPVRVVRPGAGQGSMVIHDTWRLGAPGNQYSASEMLFVNSGNTHLSQSSPVVSVTCR